MAVFCFSEGMAAPWMVGARSVKVAILRLKAMFEL